ncbi:MAG: GNAT family protein [Myxococcales bacterium]|nr:GNAT family N-acetyltransferase [Polyangiaceae bacterium]MDW8247925.1 GNAT family protein [Myxococcales bacterium]
MVLTTRRLTLVPITLPMVEAIFANDRRTAEQLAGAKLPAAWPGRALIERAFTADLEAIRRDPGKRLWGDRLMLTREPEPRVVGSVVFHGFPEDGVAEVGYGVEADSQGQGLATEATATCVDWALSQPGIQAVTASTFPWHYASLRVIARIGMHRIGSREHDLLGELWVFERRGTRTLSGVHPVASPPSLLEKACPLYFSGISGGPTCPTYSIA